MEEALPLLPFEFSLTSKTSSSMSSPCSDLYEAQKGKRSEVWDVMRGLRMRTMARLLDTHRIPLRHTESHPEHQEDRICEAFVSKF